MLSCETLLARDGIAVTISSYGAFETQAAHRDRYSRASFLVRGAYREEVSTASTPMRAGDVILKSREALHEVKFGEAGARVASIEFTADDPFESVALSWRRHTDGFTLRHMSDILAAAHAGDPVSAKVAGLDLIVGSAEENEPRFEAPTWIKHLKDELEELSLATVSVSDRACIAGFHPAYASRLFRRCYGYSISEYANAHAVRRAIGYLSTGAASLTQAALAAGFYDQSHMNRIFRRVLGRTPGAQRDLVG